MRLASIVGSVGIVALFSACNAILGNESHYELVGSAGHGTGATAGTAGHAAAGKGGSSNTGGKGGGTGAAAGSDDAGGEAGAGTGGTKPSGTGGAAAGEGGAGESAGASGEAGASGCVRRGPENCFNGIDDDCNGAVDCEDSACNGPAECRSAPSGTSLGYFIAAGDSCKTGFTQLALHQDLQVPMECKGCSCVSPTNLLCDSGVYGHGTYACPSYQFAGQLWDVYNDKCTSLPSDPNLHYYSIRGTSECTAAGTPTLDPPSWTDSETFCLADHVGAGCGAGKACLPSGASGVCTLGGNGCSASYPVDRGTWYEGYDDQRTCSECSCGLGTADCSASYINVYSDGACGANPVTLPSVQVQGDACGLAFGPQSARIIGNPVAGSGSCEVNNFMNGDATPKNGHAVCCAQ